MKMARCCISFVTFDPIQAINFQINFSMSERVMCAPFVAKQQEFDAQAERRWM